MKICILTHSLFTNYGGLLQAYALQKVLKDMGHDVVTAKVASRKPISFSKRVSYFCYHIIKRYGFGNKAYNPFRYLFTKFNNEHKLMSQISINTDCFINKYIVNIDFFNGKIAPTQDMLNQFDTLVVGSDQVWRAAYVYTPAYFLHFTKDVDIKRIAYAASFGTDNVDDYSESSITKCREGAKLFDAISVREENGIDLCKKIFGVDATHLLDPTMLLDKEDYLEVIEESDKPMKKNIMMCYVLDKSSKKQDLIDKVARELGLTEHYVMPKVKYPAYTSNECDWVYPSVSEWLVGFRDAKFIITDSFHGTVFSIIFNKPFIAINNSSRGSSRFNSLLKMFDLENRLVTSIEDLNIGLLDSIDYVDVNKIRKVWQQKSLEFLTVNLKS